MDFESAWAMLEKHVKPGYTIETIRKPGNDFYTLYLVSHRGQCTGAISVDDAGIPTIAESAHEAFSWYLTDK